MRNNLPFVIKKEIIERDNYTCQKCNFKDESLEGIEIHHKKPLILGGTDNQENLILLCSICHSYAPDNEKEFEKYINEKIDGQILNTFRHKLFSISKRTKFGMERKSKEGGFVNRPPKGYKLIDKQLVPDEQESKEILKIFKEFVDNNVSLTQLGKKNSMTTAGIKKLLQNKTYLGQVKFANNEGQGQHPAIIPQDLFEAVQNKLSSISRPFNQSV